MNKIQDLREWFAAGRIITRKQICDTYNICDVDARELVREIAKDTLIISHSKQKGYRQAITAEDIEDTVHMIRYRRKIAQTVLDPLQPAYEFLESQGYDISNV